MYVGDHPEVDIDGARSAGLTTIWKRTAHWGDCRNADWNIDELREIAAIVAAS